MKQKGEIQVIATKVTVADKAKLNRIAHRWGMSLYELLQSLLLALVRVGDDAHSSITPRHQTMLETFLRTIRSTDGSTNPLTIRNRPKEEIDGVILFVGRRQGQRPQLLAITKDAQGNLKENWNHDIMLADFLNAADPAAAKVLQTEAPRHGHFSLLAYLHDVIINDRLSPDDTMREDIDAMFSDIRLPTGERLNNEEIKYKQKYNKGDYTALMPRQKVRHADLWG